MAEIPTIEGKIGIQRYEFKINPTLEEIDFVQAMQENRKIFRSKFFNRDSVAISVWTTPKRTKTYPFTRVYDTLSYDGTKITIIPVLVDYGINGERGKVQPNTIDWMTGLGVYVILGVYIDADKGEVGGLAKNAGVNTKSREGATKFAKGQRFNLRHIQAQIEKIFENKPDVKTWNGHQITLIPSLLEGAINNYKRLSDKLKVPLGNFSILEKKVKIWKNDSKKFLADCEKESKGAQNREVKSDHALENVPGVKGKINIDLGESKKLYLTSDSVEIKKNKCLITLLEGKNTTSDKLPGWGDIKDALMKLMIFKKSDFSFEDKKYEKKLVCYLTSENKDIEKFKKEYNSLIEECDVNDIELIFNEEIIR